MRIGLFLGHPAHYHNLRITAELLQQQGHRIFFVIKKKDVLEQLLINANTPYTVIREGRGNSRFQQIKSVIQMEWNMIRFIRRNRIQILMGSTLSFAAARICRIPVIAMGEDDAHIVPRYAKLVYPFASAILSPIGCDNGKWESRTVHYPGYQKLAYLHPNRFTPDPSILRSYGVEPSSTFFLLRFAQLNAHHDNGISGFSTSVAQQVIDLLSPYGQVFITSERPLEPQFQHLQLRINPLHIHHFLAFASIYIGDSQSMAVEAAMLGTPSIRFNDFVGKRKIGILDQLEHTYRLTFSIPSSAPSQLLSTISSLLSLLPNPPISQSVNQSISCSSAASAIMQPSAATSALRREFHLRRDRMLADKIDVTAFFTFFLSHFPASLHSYHSSSHSDYFQPFK